MSLRRMMRAGEVLRDRAEEALDDLDGVNLRRHPHGDLLRRAWELRDSFTAYDAMYIALTEAIDAPLVTCDAQLAIMAVHRARIQVVR